MAHVDPTDVMGRLTVVETHMSRLPQIEQKVDGLHDDMLELRTLLQVGPRAKEITNPGFRLQEEKKSLLDKIDVDFTDVIKLAILLGTVVGAAFYAKPSHEELASAVEEHMAKQVRK